MHRGKKIFRQLFSRVLSISGREGCWFVPPWLKLTSPRTRDPKRHALRGERGGGLGMRILI